MSKHRNKNTHRGSSHKPAKPAGGTVRPASTANPDAMDMDDMSAALARAMEAVPEPEPVSPDEHAHDDIDTHAFAAIDADAAVDADASDAGANEFPAADVVASPVEDDAIAEPDAPAEDGKTAGRKKLKLHKPTNDASESEAPHEAPEAAPAQEPAPAPVRAPHGAAFAKLTEYQNLSMAHVPGVPEEVDVPGHWRGVGFGLGGRRLVSAFDEVVEIMPMPQITHVPGTQPWMLGVANVRGTLLPVVDLKQFLEGERTAMHANQRVLVVRQGGGNVAVLIDQLYGQRSFNDSQKTAMAEDESRYGHFIKQVYRVGDNDWGVFSMSMLSRTPEFRQAAA
jgi:twitching motility protein PilI